MRTLIPSLFGGAFMIVGIYVLGYSWQDVGIFGLALSVIYLANENQDLKFEISFLRDRVNTLEGKFEDEPDIF